MKRYFDLVDQKAVVEFDIKDSSPARIAPVKDFEFVYKTKMREIGKQEYLELKRQYEA